MSQPDDVPNSAQSENTIDPSVWVEEYGDYLFHFAMMHLGRAELAEELVQEAFVAGLKSKDQFKGLSKERSWLVSILKHKIIDHFRRVSRQRKVFTDDGNEDLDKFFDHTGHWTDESWPERWAENPRRALEQKDFYRSFEKCMSALPERLRRAFALREVDELDSEAICSALDISSANLWVMLHRARLRLRKCLDEHWFKETGGA